ncbi:MAG: tRNA pseudouridine(55) synthase TruB, partial [Acidobacteriota bacterium]
MTSDAPISTTDSTPRPLRDGLLLVDKHDGCTSHDVVSRCRRILRQKKIGHCGTLDPSATGLLLLTVGRATRLTRFLIRAPKVYEGSIRLGIATDTYDVAGE